MLRDLAAASHLIRVLAIGASPKLAIALVRRDHGLDRERAEEHPLLQVEEERLRTRFDTLQARDVRLDAREAESTRLHAVTKGLIVAHADDSCELWWFFRWSRCGQTCGQANKADKPTRLACKRGLRSARLDDAFGADLLRKLHHNRLQLLELEAGDGSAEELVHEIHW